VIALIVAYGGPVAGFTVPGIGRSTPRDGNIFGSHMAERCQLFLIVALGESFLVTGALFGHLERSTSANLALIVAFLGTIAFWWLYVDQSVEAASERISRHADPGRIARFAYI